MLVDCAVARTGPMLARVSVHGTGRRRIPGSRLEAAREMEEVQKLLIEPMCGEPACAGFLNRLASCSRLILFARQLHRDSTKLSKCVLRDRGPVSMPFRRPLQA